MSDFEKMWSPLKANSLNRILFVLLKINPTSVKTKGAARPLCTVGRRCISLPSLNSEICKKGSEKRAYLRHFHFVKI